MKKDYLKYYIIKLKSANKYIHYLSYDYSYGYKRIGVNFTNSIRTAKRFTTKKEAKDFMYNNLDVLLGIKNTQYSYELCRIFDSPYIEFTYNI